MSKKLIAAALGVGVAVVAAIVIFAGMDHHDSGSESGTDAAFVSEMVPHHQGAIRMARLAREKAEHPEIVALADAIIASQSTEIDQMNGMDRRLSREGEAEGDLGMSDSMMGMDMDALAKAKPFDREFIDEMIPHHQGAIHMARVALANGKDEEVRDLAEAIIVAQSAEIEKMNQWRTDWYGAPSPAGGVPAEEEDSGHDVDSMSMESMDH